MNGEEIKNPNLIQYFFNKWDYKRQLLFLDFFTQELNVCIRSIWADNILKSREKVEQVTWINEIQRRMPLIAHSIRTCSGSWDVFSAVVESYISGKENIRNMVEETILCAIQLVNGNYN